MEDKSRYKIYWGLRDEDEIPKMKKWVRVMVNWIGSSGNKKPEKPKQLGEPSLFDKLKDWIDDNKDLLKTLRFEKGLLLWYGYPNEEKQKEHR